MSIRVGMMGMGAISHYYFNSLKEVAGLELFAVCDCNERKLEEARQSGLQVAQNIGDLLRLPKLDAVIIGLPNDMHYSACKEALIAGKHVCCEKPLALDIAEAEELVDLARRHERVLLTAFHRRYNAHVLSAKATVGNRKIIHIDAHYLEKIEDHSGTDTWYLDATRCGGGCIADNGPNVFDTLSMFISNLEVVDCQIEERRAGIDVRARTRLRGDSGVTAEAKFDWAYDGERKDLDIRLEDGQHIHVDMLAGFTAFKSSLHHEYAAILTDFRTRISDRHFAGNEGLRAVQLVDAAYRAAADAAQEMSLLH